MRTLKLYRHGMTMGTPPAKNNHLRAVRGAVGGWSASSTRNNIAFLRSVVETDLNHVDGVELVPLALTLTIRDCPPTSEHWTKLRNAYIERLRRLGMVRMHWVTEWQRRGVPHLHCAVWFNSKDEWLAARVIQSWCSLVADYGANPISQHVTPIYDSVGWSQYVSKHCARGVSHYQRSPENIPEAWQQKTGRVWGKVGHWPTQDKIDFRIESKAFHITRRILRGWRIADARSDIHNHVKGGRRRLVQARGMLRQNERNLSDVLGASEWVDENTILSVLYWLKSQGYRVEC